MANVEALHEVKRVEEEVRKARAAAAAQSAEILKKAREESYALTAKGRAEAEAAMQAELARAAKAVAEDRARILKAGQAEADKIRQAASGPALAAAVDIILRRFNEKIRG